MREQVVTLYVGPAGELGADGLHEVQTIEVLNGAGRAGGGEDQQELIPYALRRGLPGPDERGIFSYALPGLRGHLESVLEGDPHRPQAPQRVFAKDVRRGHAEDFPDAIVHPARRVYYSGHCRLEEPDDIHGHGVYRKIPAREVLSYVAGLDGGDVDGAGC